MSETEGRLAVTEFRLCARCGFLNIEHTAIGLCPDGGGIYKAPVNAEEVPRMQIPVIGPAQALDVAVIVLRLWEERKGVHFLPQDPEPEPTYNRVDQAAYRLRVRLFEAPKECLDPKRTAIFVELVSAAKQVLNMVTVGPDDRIEAPAILCEPLARLAWAVKQSEEPKS